jgi:thiamine-phosphate pyrophosphorylase
MNDSSALPQSLYIALVHSLKALEEGCQSLLGDTTVLHRLHDLTTDLQSTAGASPGAPFPHPTINSTLALASTAQGLLAALSEGIDGHPFSAETAQALSQTLAVLEAGLGAALRKEQAHRIRGLYVIIDPEVTGGRDPLEIAAAAIQGGARMLQLRDKLRDKSETLLLGIELQQQCQANDVLLIINDQADLAAAVGSGGVHVGQTDMPVAEARRVLAPHQVVGRSNREFEQLIESQEMGADHMAFGSIYQTSTKSVGRPPQGVERLRQAREVSKVPLVAIGGINAENVAPVVEAGADAICVTAAVGAAPDPEAAASRLVEAIRRAGGKV